MPVPTLLLARQPIYDRQLEIVGYELLFRSANGDRIEEIGGTTASSEVLIHAFTNLPRAHVFGNALAFVNFTRELLGHSPTFPPEQLVIELLEDVEVDDWLIARVSELKQQGYTLALDDFVRTEQTAPLIELADIIKLDVLGKTEAEVAGMLAEVRGSRAKLLAEKVETHEMMNICRQLGFDYFQGYFLSKPEHVEGCVLAENQLAVISLLGKLNSVDTTLHEIEAILASDAVLAFKLLKMVNSPAMRTGEPTDSIKRGIQLMGFEKIRSWTTLLALTRLSKKPRGLIMATLVRAFMCQAMAMSLGQRPQADRYFTAGLLSMLDAFMDQAMTRLVAELELADDMGGALLRHDGLMGMALNTALCFERADWTGMPLKQLTEAGVSLGDLAGHYLYALERAHETSELLA